MVLVCGVCVRVCVLIGEDLTIILKFIWKNRKKNTLRFFKNKEPILTLPDTEVNYKAKIIAVELH